MRKRDGDTEAAMHSCEDALALLQRLNDHELPALRRQLVQARELAGASPEARRLLADAIAALGRGGRVGQAFLKCQAHAKAVWYVQFYAPFNRQKERR